MTPPMDLPHTTVRVLDIPDCELCQITGDNVVSHLATVDGKTKIKGMWGYMCDEAHTKYGVGLGLGLGQRLLKIEPAPPRSPLVTPTMGDTLRVNRGRH